MDAAGALVREEAWKAGVEHEKAMQLLAWPAELRALAVLPSQQAPDQVSGHQQHHKNQHGRSPRFPN